MNELCVPVSAISLAGEDNSDVAPEAGDQVSVTVEGKVSRIEGGQAYVTPETANGEPMGGPEQPPGPPHEEPAGETEDQEMAGLRRDMMNQEL